MHDYGWTDSERAAVRERRLARANTRAHQVVTLALTGCRVPLRLAQAVRAEHEALIEALTELVAAMTEPRPLTDQCSRATAAFKGAKDAIALVDRTDAEAGS